MQRVSSLPLVSSTYDLMSSVYSNTKDTHPYIRTMCEAAEQGVWGITHVVLTTAWPILDKLEPQSKKPRLNFVDLAVNMISGHSSEAVPARIHQTLRRIVRVVERPRNRKFSHDV